MIDDIHIGQLFTDSTSAIIIEKLKEFDWDYEYTFTFIKSLYEQKKVSPESYLGILRAFGKIVEHEQFINGGDSVMDYIAWKVKDEIIGVTYAPEEKTNG